jgi:hypothetical protein
MMGFCGCLSFFVGFDGRLWVLVDLELLGCYGLWGVWEVMCFDVGLVVMEDGVVLVGGCLESVC